METPRPTDDQAHTSVLLQQLIVEAPEGHFTMEWLIGHLPRHSFGFIFLFLSIIALLPVISIVARILIIILTFQIILGYTRPSLPQRLMIYPLPSKYLIRLNRHAVPMLRYLENIVRPRWPVMLRGTRRFAAFIVMLAMTLSLLAPIPLANMPPAAVGILLALAYIEHDGLILAFALAAAVAMLLLTLWAVFSPFLY